jgi:Tfp pilus assembly major pilin PilA
MRPQGFTVFERFVVVAIILATIAIVIPSVWRSRASRSVGPEYDQRSMRGDSK